MSTTSTTTVSDGHGTTEFIQRLTEMISAERLSPREVVTAVTRALEQALDGQPIPGGDAHTYSVDDHDRLVSVMIHEASSAFSIRSISERMEQKVDAARAEQPQEV